MEQEPLFHEDIYGAVSHVASALGGYKPVGSMLWPSLSPDNAGRKLANCLNPERPENLKPEELILILLEGRKAGVHSAMAFINDQAGYDTPKPLEPEDERAKLQREYIEATQVMANIAGRMERLTAAGGK